MKRAAPRNLLPRFRRRTLVLIVAGLACLCGIILAAPWLLWRFHAAQALEAARSTGPDHSWSFNLINAPRRDELLYLLSDRERVLSSLIQTAEYDPDEKRRIHAVQTGRVILKHPASPSLRQECLDAWFRIATGARISPPLEFELAQAIADGVGAIGLDPERRTAILARAKGSSSDRLPGWVRVLAQIGGREETLFLMDVGHIHDDALLNAVHNSSLVRSAWPGLLPALERWLDDPQIAPRALRYAILSQASEGRDLLIAYAASERRPVEQRRRAVEVLQQTIPGVRLLQETVAKPEGLKSFAAMLGNDPAATFQAALEKLEREDGEAFWMELIEGVETAYPNSFPNPATEAEKATAEAEDRIRRHIQDSSLQCLRWLAKRPDLKTQAEWRGWYESTRPKSLGPCDLATLVLDHPEAIQAAPILRRIVPRRRGSVPDECIPLYERLAREATVEIRYWACAALLLDTSRTDITPVAIELIGERRENEDRPGSWGPIELLKERYAENFFGDVAGWREWWSAPDRRP